MANILPKQLCLSCNLQATAKLIAKTVLICQLRGESFAELPFFLCCVYKSLLALKPLFFYCRAQHIIWLHVERLGNEIEGRISWLILRLIGNVT